MAQVVIARFDVDGLTTSAIEILKAAVMYANEHAGANVHQVSTRLLCQLSGIPTPSYTAMCLLMNEVRRSLAIYEVIDTASRNREDLPYASWPVFKEIVVGPTNVKFRVCDSTFDPRLLAVLKELKSSSRQTRRSLWKSNSTAI